MNSLALPSTPVRRVADLPSPPALPLLGHLHRLPPTSAHLRLEAWAAELAQPYRIQIGKRPVVVFHDHETAHQLLRDRPQGVRRAGMLRPVFAEMGIDGVFSAEGQDWLPQRRLIMQSLNATQFRGFYPTLQGITERLFRRWLRAATTGQVIDMTQDLVRYTVDVTSALSFGEDPNTLETEGPVIQQALASIFPTVMRRTLAPLPWWRWMRLPADRQLERDLGVVHRYAQARIASARSRMAAAPGQAPCNALEAMLAQRDRPGSGFDDERIVANVLTLLLGGEDTTAHSLAWTLYHLAQDPALQDRLHHMAIERLGADAVCPQHERLRELDAFEALATEATRLRPVAAFYALETVQDRVAGGVELPAGTRMFYLTRPAQVSSRHFAQPLSYRPERWCSELGSMPGVHNARAFLQFGTGPRVCPGRHLAGMEIRLVLSMLLRHFEVELACDPRQVRELLHFTLAPDRMPVRLRLRPVVQQRVAVAPRRPVTGCPFGHG